MKLYCMVIADGYLYGATTDNDGDDSGGYWMIGRGSELTSESWCLYEVEVPPGIDPDPFMLQGTTDQFFDDGYQAWDEVLRRLGSRTLLDYGNGGICWDCGRGGPACRICDYRATIND